MRYVDNVGIRMRLISLMALICLFLAAPSHAKSKSAFEPSNTIDFSRLEGGQYTVEVMLNGDGPYVFMIDSAATRTSIFERTVAKLNLDDTSSTQALISGMTATRMRPTLPLRSLSFGKTLFKDHSVVILENWEDQTEPLDGILGLEVLQNFVLSFSHGKNRLRIRDSFNPKARRYKGWNKVALIPNPYPVADHGLRFTGARIGEVLIPVMIDTGSNFTTISWNSVEGSELGKEKERLRDEWMVQGAVGDFEPRMAVRLDEINIGGIRLLNHELLLMSFPELQVNGKGQYPLIIAGIDLMGGRDFVFDFKNDVLYVEPDEINQQLPRDESRLLQYDQWQ